MVQKKKSGKKNTGPAKKQDVKALEEKVKDMDLESSSDEEEVIVKKPIAKKAVPKKKESSSDEDSSEDEKPAPKKPVPKKPTSEKESSDDDSSEEETPVKKPVPKKAVPTKKVESSSDESSSEEEKPVKKTAPKKPVAKDSSDDESSEEETPVKKPAPKAVPKKKVESSSDDDSDVSSSDDEKKVVKKVIVKKVITTTTTKGPAKKQDVFAEFASEQPKEETMTKAQLKRLQKKQADAAAAGGAVAPAAPAAPVEEDKEDGPVDESKLSKTALAKLKKKQKEEAAKAAASQKKGGKMGALKEKMLAERAEVERLKKEEEDRIKREEEEEAAALAEEARIAAEKEAKKAAKLAKREADKKAGLILTKAQKEKKKRAEAAREQLAASGLVPAEKDTEKAEVDADQEKKSKKVVYSKKGGKSGGASKTMGKTKAQVEAEELAAKIAATQLKEEKEALVLEGNWEESEEEEEDTPVDPALVSSEPEEEVVPDSWDYDSGEERNKKAASLERKAKRQVLRDQAAKKKADVKASKRAEKETARKQAQAKILQERKEKAAADEAAKQKAEAEEKKAAAGDTITTDQMRSPICCILGHVDTGKTKLLDKIRSTNVQDNEAGGITQQIGASYFPKETVITKIKPWNELQEPSKKVELKVPGLLVIDTPGHESFTNLRSRGSGLCDIAILVVDIMHGLEPQTIESINLLKMRKTPFVVALNKVDRLYGWKSTPDGPFQSSLAQQNFNTKQEFDTRSAQVIDMFAKEGLNCALYYNNTDYRKYINLIPTSAITGEGIPDLLGMLIRLTQAMMNQRLMYLDSLQCTVLEVKVVEGLGTTIDVILVNGALHEGDTIVLCGMQGPIVTTIRALLTPPPLREIRVKSEYQKNKVVHAAAGLKISANGMESAVAGSQLLVCGPKDNIEELKDEAQAELGAMLSNIDKTGQGVCVQASTLGSLEALMTFLKTCNIPVSGINIGPVHKKDVMRAGVMLEKRPEFALILAFDVTVAKDATTLATEMGVKIFTADIIYHLFDQCTAYMEEIKIKKRDEAAAAVVFPCVLTVLPNCIFRDRDPLIIGFKVTEGIVKVGTPLSVPDKEFLRIGRIISIQVNGTDVKEAIKGQEVCLKIEAGPGEQKIMYARHFDHTSLVMSRVTRESIDLLKANFKDDLKKEDWQLVIKLKKVFNVDA